MNNHIEVQIRCGQAYCDHTVEVFTLLPINSEAVENKLIEACKHYGWREISEPDVLICEECWRRIP